MPKVIRFGDLVRQSGRPDVVLLWEGPKPTPPFARALKQNRVLTVFQPPTGKKDFGRVGFHRDRHASYLVFPRRLQAEPNIRVVGINYDLLEQP